MQIYYTNKLIFWDNKSNDQLEDNVFEEYLNDWIQLPNTKSINWLDHYNANFYASDNFEATYFKIIKNNKVYYFFIDNIEFDNSNGKQFFLKMDFYNTYTKQLIKILKQENPNVVFKRKHANRFTNDLTGMGFDPIEQWYVSNIPEELSSYKGQLPLNIKNLSFKQPAETRLLNVITQAREVVDFSDYLWDGGLGKNRYWYLKVKRPARIYEKSIYLNRFNFSSVFYVPIKVSTTDLADRPNTYSYISNWPDSDVVGLVSSAIPPWAITDCYSQAWRMYTDDILSNNESIVLTPVFNDYHVIDNDVLKDFLKTATNNKFSATNTTYNIRNYFMEPMLWLPPFLNVSINQSLEIPTQYYLNTFIKTTLDPSSYTLSIYSLTGTTINALLDNSNNVLKYTPNSKYVFTAEERHPFMGSAFTEYIKYNANSLDTGIQLAKEQKRILDAGSTGSLGVGILSGLGGTLAAAFTGNIGGIFKGFGAFGNSVISNTQNLAMNKFNLKAKLASTEAKLTDVSNQTGTIKDTYSTGLSSLADPSGMYITYQSLSEDEQKVVFSNIYFYGYVINTVMNFIEYDNRINFNYFEIANGSELATQYLKLPKNIINDIGQQLETGIRLWKTPYFDYSMSLDNKEKIWN